MRRLPRLVTVVSLLTVTACSGSSTLAGAHPSASAHSSATASPTVSSPSVSTTSTAAGTPPPPVASYSTDVLSTWKDCHTVSGFQCATLTVPLDPGRPSLGTVGLALTRHKATGDDRIGTLLVNPGGPGASAVDFIQQDYTGIPEILREHFDIAAFDPVGVGHSDPVTCLTTAQLDAYIHINPVPDTAAQRAALDAGNEEFAQGCEKDSGRILPYVGTTIVAQDMDRVRAALGDAKLTYLGYSYGTAIGASYLDQFPTHVRAMVLDGALNPTLTWSQLVAGQAKGFDVAFDSFLSNCQAIDCAFRQSVTGNLGAAYDALYARVEQKPLPGDGSRVVGPAEFSLGVGYGLYSTSLWPDISQALADAEKGNGQYLLALSDAYNERTSAGYDSLIESEDAVNCVDRPWPHTDPHVYALAAQIGKTYPRFGPAIILSALSCKYWPVAPTSTPHAVTGKGSPPIVVIGTTRDPATPYMWAVALAKQLVNGILLTHDGDGHTVFRVGAPSCIVDPVDNYFVNLTAPAPATC